MLNNIHLAQCSLGSTLSQKVGFRSFLFSLNFLLSFLCNFLHLCVLSPRVSSWLCETHCVAKVGPKLAIFLHQPPKCWSYRYVPHLTRMCFLYR